MSDKAEPLHFTPQEGFNRGGGDRRSSGNSHYYTDAHWHGSKAVSITNLVGFLVIIVGGTGAYYSNTAMLTSFIETNKAEIRTINLRLDTLELTSASAIPPSTLMEKFKSEDEKIDHISEQVDEVKIALRNNREAVDKAMALLIALPTKVKLEIENSHK